MESWNNGSPTPEFNNAAQVWNHTFYWESMSPSPTGAHCSRMECSEHPFQTVLDAAAVAREAVAPPSPSLVAAFVVSVCSTKRLCHVHFVAVSARERILGPTVLQTEYGAFNDAC